MFDTRETNQSPSDSPDHLGHFSLRSLLKITAYTGIVLGGMQSCSKESNNLGTQISHSNEIAGLRWRFIDSQFFPARNELKAYEISNFSGALHSALSAILHTPHDSRFLENPRNLTTEFNVIVESQMTLADNEELGDRFINRSARVRDYKQPLSTEERQELYLDYRNNQLGQQLNPIPFPHFSYLLDMNRFFQKSFDEKFELFNDVRHDEAEAPKNQRNFSELVTRYLDEVVAPHTDILLYHDNSFTDFRASVVKALDDTSKEGVERAHSRAVWTYSGYITAVGAILVYEAVRFLSRRL